MTESRQLTTRLKVLKNSQLLAHNAYYMNGIGRELYKGDADPSPSMTNEKSYLVSLKLSKINEQKDFK